MGENLTADYQSVTTPDGPFTIITDASGAVLASGWTDDPWTLSQRIHRSIRPANLVEGNTGAADAVAAYYAGDATPAKLFPVVQHGTAAQQRGWETLRTIPAGQPMSYAEFAAACGNPAAARAAASICARNAAGLFVPCHRVLRGNGELGGFAWGTPIKRSLLERETAMR